MSKGKSGSNWLEELEPVTPKPRNWLYQTVGIFGPPKSGKSSIVANIPNCLILNTEREEAYDHVGVEIYKVEIKDWQTFVKVIRDLQTKPHNFKTIVVDTVTALFRMCVKSVCKRNEWENISSPGHGIGYTTVRDTFRDRLQPLIDCERFGVVFIAHSKIRDIGGERTKSSFDFDDKVLPDWLRSQCSTLLNVENSKVQFRETATVEAGTRWKLKQDFIKINHDDFATTYKGLVDNFIVNPDGSLVEKEEIKEKESEKTDKNRSF